MKEIKNNKTSKKDANPPDFLFLPGEQLEAMLLKMVTKMSKEELMDAILNAFPLEENKEYVGSLANHFRGRLKYDGAEVLIRSMCNVSLRQLIIYLQKIQN